MKFLLTTLIGGYKMTIQIYNNQNDTWTVFNKKTGATTTIVKCCDNGGFLGSNKNFYRVDGRGPKTIATMVEHFQTAKSIAIKNVQ